MAVPVGRESDRRKWLLIHRRDDTAIEGWDAEDHPASVKTGGRMTRSPQGATPGTRRPLSDEEILERHGTGESSRGAGAGCDAIAAASSVAARSIRSTRPPSTATSAWPQSSVAA